MPGPSDLQRSWRGVAPKERVAERRERILEAGLEVFAAKSFHGAKVRDICVQASLTERYFYESFANKEALLYAVADRIVEDFLAAVAPKVPAIREDFEQGLRAAVDAFIGSIADDPRRAQILFVEAVGVSPEAEDRRRAIIGELVSWLSSAAELAVGPWVRGSDELELMARAVIGAVAELLVAHVRGELRMEREELVLNISRILMRILPILLALGDEQQKINLREVS